jgi:hypothetical protein
MSAPAILKSSSGIDIAEGGIFRILFPAKKPTGVPQPPFIGEHVGVVIGVQAPTRVVVIYGESAAGPYDKRVQIDPGTPNGYPFTPWIKHSTYFRMDTVALVHVDLVGDKIGDCLKTTTADLKGVAFAGLHSKLQIDVHWYQPPALTPTPSGGVLP